MALWSINSVLRFLSLLLLLPLLLPVLPLPLLLLLVDDCVELPPNPSYSGSEYAVPATMYPGARRRFSLLIFDLGLVVFVEEIMLCMTTFISVQICK